MSVKDEFARKVEADKLCAKVLKALRENDEAALRRMGFDEFARYAERLSDIMTATVGEELDYSEDFAALMEQVASPVHYAYHLVTECGVGVQQAFDAQNGTRIQPVQPKFNDKRLKSIVGEAAEGKTEKAPQNFATQLGTFIKSTGNNFMKANAQQRAKAGFTVMIERTGGANCCPWCAGLVGRWTIKNAPKDVFGCHDNCTCTVVYTNSRGVTSQRVGDAKFVEVEYEPKRLTDGEKRGAGEPKKLTDNPVKGQPKRLTGGEKSGILNLINLSDEILGRSIGAKAKTIWVRMPDGTQEALIEGSKITNKKIIAGKGRDRQIDIEDLLNYKHPEATPGEWVKIKGIGSLYDEYGEERKAELHWYENPTVSGKVDLKLKPRNGALYIDDD